MNSTESSQTKWIGYHGTSLKAAHAISHGNYAISSNDAEWLGHGAYFFIEGLNNPQRKAEEWAKFRSWDKTTRSHKYSEYAVLQSELYTDIHLDLDDPEDLEMFEAVRERCSQRMRQEGFRGTAIESDCYLSNFAMQDLGLDALVRREAIQTQRSAFKTRIPNCRILCLKDPERCVKGHNLVKRGRVR